MERASVTLAFSPDGEDEKETPKETEEELLLLGLL